MGAVTTTHSRRTRYAWVMLRYVLRVILSTSTDYLPDNEVDLSGGLGMVINRDARVRATDGELGRVRHVIVDPDTHELTDIVVGDDVREWLIPTSAVQNADGGEVTLAGSVNELTSTASHFDRDCYHGVDSG